MWASLPGCVRGRDCSSTDSSLTGHLSSHANFRAGRTTHPTEFSGLRSHCLKKKTVLTPCLASLAFPLFSQPVSRIPPISQPRPVECLHLSTLREQSSGAITPSELPH